MNIHSSNNPEQQDFGSDQDVVRPSDHPEVIARKNEVMEVARNLSPEEICDAIYDFASTKYHRLKNSN